jgi:hypothetical protein
VVQHGSTMTTHASTIVAKDKAQSYTKWTLKDDFITLAIKTYNCLHPCFDSFFISYVHAYIAHH